MNAAHNGNSVISYYPLPSFMVLLARLQNCTILSSLDLRSGYHHSNLTPEAKPKTVFATTSGKWHWNMAPFSIYSLHDVFCCLMLQVLSHLDFFITYLNDILVYSVSWKKHLQHLKVVFQHLKEANLKTKLSKCQFSKNYLHNLKSPHLQIGCSAIPRISSSHNNVTGTQ